MPVESKTACSSGKGKGAPAEIASRRFAGIAFASCHARQSAGTAGSVMLSAVLAARRTASGNGESERMAGKPGPNNGVARVGKTKGRAGGKKKRVGPAPPSPLRGAQVFVVGPKLVAGER